MYTFIYINTYTYLFISYINISEAIIWFILSDLRSKTGCLIVLLAYQVNVYSVIHTYYNMCCILLIAGTQYV